MSQKRNVRCPRCSSTNVQARNNTPDGRKKYQCMECKRRGERKTYFTYPTKNTDTTEKITEEGNTREISTLVPVRIQNVQELVAQCEIDTEVWELERWLCDKKEVIHSGSLKVLFQVKAWLGLPQIRNTDLGEARVVVALWLCNEFHLVQLWIFLYA